MGIEEALVLVYLIANFLAFTAFFWDKAAARRKGRRIRVRTLLALSLLGPFGAAAGMRVFRHKTRKRVFLLVPLFLLLHVVLILAIALNLL